VRLPPSGYCRSEAYSDHRVQEDEHEINNEDDGRGTRKTLIRLTYSPISPSPGIRGRLSVDSSGGSRKPAHEESKSDETTRKIAAAEAVVALMQ
jgi:hypothetical protein